MKIVFMDHGRKPAHISPMKYKERQDGPQVTNHPMLTSSPGKCSNYDLWLAGNERGKKATNFSIFWIQLPVITYPHIGELSSEWLPKISYAEPEFLGT